MGFLIFDYVKRIAIISVILILIITFLILYYNCNPASNALFPKCTFYNTTGLKCPGCGSQRALHALFNGNFIEAFRYNAMFILGIPLILLLLYLELIRTKKPEIYTKINSKYIITGIGIIIIFWWIIRNIFNL